MVVVWRAVAGLLSVQAPTTEGGKEDEALLPSPPHYSKGVYMDNNIAILIDYLHKNKNNPLIMEAFKSAVIFELNQGSQGCVHGLLGTDCKNQELFA